MFWNLKVGCLWIVSIFVPAGAALGGRRLQVATMLHQAQWAAGNIFRYMAIGAFWDTFVIKETLTHFRIYKDLIRDGNIPVSFTVWCMASTLCRMWVDCTDTSPPFSPLLSFPPQMYNRKQLVDVIQRGLLNVGYLPIPQEVWTRIHFIHFK